MELEHDEKVMRIRCMFTSSFFTKLWVSFVYFDLFGPDLETMSCQVDIK